MNETPQDTTTHHDATTSPPNKKRPAPDFWDTVTTDEYLKVVKSMKYQTKQNTALRTQIRTLNAKLSVATSKITDLDRSASKAVIAYDASKLLLSNALALEKSNTEKMVTSTISRLNLECERKIDVIRKAHMDECKKITMSVNDLRFTEIFGISFKKGTPFCPVTQTFVLPMEIVVSLNADCACNCMVKYDFATKYLTDFKNGVQMKCPSCGNAKIYKLNVSTAEQSERAFAWNAVQRTTSCDTHDKMLEKRLHQMETEEAEKTAQSTATLRNLVQEFQVSAGKVMTTFK